MEDGNMENRNYWNIEMLKELAGWIIFYLFWMKSSRCFYYKCAVIIFLYKYAFTLYNVNLISKALNQNRPVPLYFFGAMIFYYTHWWFFSAIYLVIGIRIILITETLYRRNTFSLNFYPKALSDGFTGILLITEEFQHTHWR